MDKTMTLPSVLSSLPDKVKAKINSWLKIQKRHLNINGSVDAFHHYTLCGSDGDENREDIVPLNEWEIIGLLTAWLESEGWEWGKLIGGRFWFAKNGVSFLEPTFWQAFEKVTKIMEEQE